MTAEYMSFSGMTKSNVGSGTVRILGRSGSDISGGVKITPEMIETLKEAKENGTEVEVLKELLQITDENPYIHVSSLSPKDYADRNSIPYESKSESTEEQKLQPSEGGRH